MIGLFLGRIAWERFRKQHTWRSSNGALGVSIYIRICCVESTIPQQVDNA